MKSTATSISLSSWSFLISVICLSISYGTFAQDRPFSVFSGGPAANNGISISGWTSSNYQAVDRSYVPGSSIPINLFQSESIFGSDFLSKNISDVLIIAHDLPGLAARGAIQNNLEVRNRTKGLVLVGVPNQGAKIYSHFAPDVNGGISDARKTVATIKAFISTARGCRDCNQSDLMLNLAERIESSNGFGLFARPGGEYISSLENTVHVPTVLMYGDIGFEPFAFSRVIGSGSLQATPDLNFIACMEDELQDRRDEIDDEFSSSTIENVINMASNITRFFDPERSFTAIVSSIVSIAQSIRRQISTVKRRDRLTGELLECEYAFQALNSEWQLWVGRGWQETEVPRVEIIDCPCQDDCEAQFPPETRWRDRFNWDECLNDCERQPNGGCNVRFVTGFSYFTSRPSDGFYGHSEMDLPGAVRTYIMEDTDHWQSFNSPDHQESRAAFQDMYAGGAGAAFALDRR